MAIPEDLAAEWTLLPDGPPLITGTARLFPVRKGGRPAILKIAASPEEQRGGSMMAWWNGRGAAQVLAAKGDAVLLERAQRSRCLAAMARAGNDPAATRIICGVLHQLHEPREDVPTYLVPLPAWFQALESVAATQGAVLARCADVARLLLGSMRDVGPLHGDIHHGNVLDFGPRGWLAIDPKGLLGERAFDYANLFCNPDLADPTTPVATIPDRFARRVALVSCLAGIDRRRPCGGSPPGLAFPPHG